MTTYLRDREPVRLMTNKEISEERAAANALTNYMATELRKMQLVTRPKIDTSKMSEEEKQALYLSMQPESTKKTLLRDPKDDELHYNRAVLNAMAIPGCDISTEEGRDKAVAARALSAKEVTLEEQRRRSPKNSLGDVRDHKLAKEARERAVHAFTYSKPASPTMEELKRLTKLSEVEVTHPDPIAEPPKEAQIGILKRIFKFLFEEYKTL